MSTQAESIIANSIENPSNQAVIARISQSQLAWADITSGLQKWRIWLLMAYQDIRLRYRRSVLGPFWITISMAVTVYSMGFLYAHLFRVDMNQYYPFLVAGMLGWALISTIISDLTETFVGVEGLIKQIKLPYTLYIHRVITRNFLIFFHNLAVMVPIFILFHQHAKLNFFTLLIIPGLLLTYCSTFIYGLILAMLGARYRDISQIIKSLIQVVFFITPVMWNPMILPEKTRYLVHFNPFYSFLELIRAPLTGTAPALLDVAMTLGITLIGMLIMWRLFVPYRARIIYWL